MHAEVILRLLDWWADHTRLPSGEHASRVLCEEAAALIRELQENIAAEREDHEATIKHCDELINRGQ